MNTSKKVCVAILCAAVAMLLGNAETRAQKPQVTSRVVQAVDDTRTVRLQGNVHPLAKPAYDQGAVADSQPMTRMMLLLQRSSEQEAALRQLLDDQQTQGSANFHAWLTPEQFGKQYGPSDADVQAVTDWLTRQGFSIAKVSAGRTVIEFSGNVSQVRNAFHTELHRFTVNGEEHFANVDDPTIPNALSPVVSGVMGLHNFRKRSFLHRVGKFRRDLKSGQITPLFTFNDINGTFYAVGPADFATIYHIPAGADGTGQSIALVGRVNILAKDVCDFRTMFSLAPGCPTYQTNNLRIILNGPDPGLIGPDGTTGDEGESDLDVEWAGAVAPAAQVILVTTEATQTDGVDGVDASSLYIVDNNVAAVMSNSYTSCESNLGSGGNTFYSALWQQASAEGITVVVPVGDSGAAGCDNPDTEATAVNGVGVNGLASTPYNVAVGGTDFNQVNNQSAYWNANGDGSNLYPSAKGYIPELPWNDSCAGVIPSSLTACASATASSGLDIVGGGGGPSGLYPKPIWQTGTGVPADGVRDIPDVSLFASDGGLNGNNKSFYVVCQSDAIIPGDTDCNLTARSNTAPYHDFQAVGGTSAASPTFAAIIALVNQKTGQRQGNANYVLYHLATVAPTAFHDITSGNNSVPCTGGSPNCSSTSASTTGVMTTTTGGHTLAFTAGAGYDLATGLGSVDVTNLLNDWAAPSFKTTNTTLNSFSPTSLTVDAPVTLKGTVTSGAGTPTGVVVLQNAATEAPIDSFTLDASGTFNAWTTTFLPGGSYSVKVHYGGDGNFGPSDSAAMAVNVGKQNSKVIVNWVDANGNLTQNPPAVQYGSAYILRIDVANNSGVPCQNIATGAIGFVCPTGTISLFQNTGVPLNDFPPTNGNAPANVSTLNDRGFAEDQSIQLAPGSYSITATYSGDGSYSAQPSSNQLSVKITQATTTTSVGSNLSTITSGQSVILTAQVSSSSNSTLGPTGMVQFKSGGANLGSAVACTAVGATASAGASCTVTLTTSISALYPPPASGPRTPLLPVIVALLSVVLFALGWRWMPERRRRAYAYAGLVAFALLAVGIAGCGGGGGGNTSTTRVITAVYPGDTNYSGSTSPGLTITLN